ncbi:hypothetical protein PR048_001570 [Dryococelus australis]|uniref:HAT C-terminal dimerisation domain-containing protein n=1 Tax=Dryococelus australis TaxID=614101 RepID=A0ABQ9IIF4_9NEOP|nr:hypothetical protein PR048_001570 [Dryococelus australis]
MLTWNLIQKVKHQKKLYKMNKVCKYLLTIPLIRVSCERAFSKLKLIKTRLHSNMTNDNLETFWIMQCERDKLVALDNDMIIDKLCEQSEEMRRLLVL